MLYAGFAAKIIYEKYGIPYVITEHSSAFARNLIAEDVLDSLKPVVDQAKVCIAVSQNFSYFLEKKFSSSVWHYIPNIVNDDFSYLLRLVSLKMIKKLESLVFVI